MIILTSILRVRITSPRRIGDRYVTIDSDGKLTFNGDWDNRSKHIYVSDFTEISLTNTKSIGSNGTQLLIHQVVQLQYQVIFFPIISVKHQWCT